MQRKILKATRKRFFVTKLHTPFCTKAVLLNVQIGQRTKK
nr:MAG TPA: hypothetical protein [Caudoviricetes sp.]